ncbi:ABC transporter ATP-binding protein [Paraburkholderia tropica]|uniref:ABC transporter ATP-binding protein n=1 Tax=Paraburkholderia tropica TaxID=92647 RepID=UPI003016ABE9
MTTSALKIDGVNQVFDSPNGRQVVALNGIDIIVESGEFVSIVGASGSGKSTLLRIISGLLQPTNGQVLIDGQRVRGPGMDRALVFQRDSLLPWKTVIDNVAYGLTLRGVRIVEARRTVQRFIDVAGLGGFEHHYPHQLSGGMRQRANVARAMAVDPKILMLDEPFASLDSQTREIMQAELLRIWEATRKTVLMITHQIDEAVLLSDRVIVFSARPGKVKRSIPVSFERPRSLSLKRSPEFTALVDEIWQLIEDEVRASLSD